MIRVTFSWLLDVIQAIDALDHLQAGNLDFDRWYKLFNAKRQTENLYFNSVYSSYLLISRDQAQSLISTIDSTIGEEPDEQKEIDQTQVWLVGFNKNQLRTVLISEMSSLPSFLVSRKAGYDTNALIENGYKLFPTMLTARVPEAYSDAIEAGKALAYELPTACGFHIFRVVEAVLKKYWEAVTGKGQPSLKTIGNFAKELEKGNHGDPKIWSALSQLASLHRNPLVHPEVLLSLDEAFEVLGISTSVVGAMLRKLPDFNAVSP